MLLGTVTTRRSSRQRGVVSAELALVLPVLLLLLLGICEIGLLIADSLVLGNACREATRAASMGRTTAEIRSVATGSLPASIALTTEDITLERRSLVSGVWGDWTTLGDNTSVGSNYNNAGAGNQIRVTLTYQHRLVTGLILQAANQNGTLTLRTSMVMLRY